MHQDIGVSCFRQAIFGALATVFVGILLLSSTAHAQVKGLAERNMSKMANYQNECAIIKNPTNKFQLFAACNNATGGLFAARSTDEGVTWVYPDPSKTIANGINLALGPAACCDPALAWDTFGNLYITYIDSGLTNIVTLLSPDGGQTFAILAQFGPANVDQPTVTADSGEVWIVWNQGGQMVARGAAVTGLGTANIGAFGALQTIPGTANCSFGDIAISPNGAVVQTCESPSGGAGPANILVNIKSDGLGPNPFGPAITATATNVGGFAPIPAQSRRTIDAEAGLAYDRNPLSPHFGRLYLVYTDAPAVGNNDTNIMVRFSDTDGANWSNPPIRVNDDTTNNSQFLPRIASNRLSGNIAVCWHDARNSPGNNTMQEFCTIATPAGPSPAFMPNAQISGGTSDGNGSNPPAAGQADIQFGDYSGLTYFQGLGHPAWADDTNSTADNPDNTTRYDAYTNRVTGGAAANEGVLQYAVKFICGKPGTPVVAPGLYYTAINVHNPAHETVQFQKKIAIALPSEKPGRVTRFFDTKLGPDEALEIDCPDILRHAGEKGYAGEKGFLKGFAVIETTSELDVVAVYTAAGTTRTVETLFMERVSPRRPQ